VRPKPRAPTPEEVRVEAEFARSAGIDRLIELANDGPSGQRSRALRGLGRSGGELARAHLGRALEAGRDRVAAARAYGLLGEEASAKPLLRAFEGADTELQRALFAALSRVAVAEDRGALLPLLATGLGADDPQVAAAAGLALGRLGRRGIEFDTDCEGAAVLASRRSPAALRYGATYALARGASLTPEVMTALRERLHDDDPEVRAEAIVGLARSFAPADQEATKKLSEQARVGRGHGDLGPDLTALEGALGDPSWTVVIEAMRALTGTEAPISGRLALIERLRRALSVLAGDSPPGTELHVIEVGLERLGPFAAEPEVAKFAKQTAALSLAHLGARARARAARTADAEVAFSRIHCRALALAIRGGAPAAGIEVCGGPVSRGSSVYLRRAILAELAGSGFAGGVKTLGELAVHVDARVRLAAVIGLGTHGRSSPAARAEVLNMLLDAIKDPSTAVSGASSEIVGALMRLHDGSGTAERARVLGALLDASEGTGTVNNPEFEAALLGALKAVVESPPPVDLEPAQTSTAEPLPAALQARVAERCRIARGAPLPVRTAGSACLKVLPRELSGRASETPAEAPERSARSPLAFDPRPLLGTSVLWTLDTTKGVITIRLDPEVAPWSVAALVDLSRRAYYSDVAWHRVVPGFVVQGGDPSGTGWGGPGFSSPGEASWSAFSRGAVGIADAGLDTGGSQFFIMHRRAAHLEGRYTWVGEVLRGQDVVDRLTTDDRILSAMVDIDGAQEASARRQ